MEEKYAVFNPLLGIYKTDLTLDEAKQEFANVAKNIIDNNSFPVNKCITQENGDITWESVQIFTTNVIAEIIPQPIIE
jgi:hypothetical protein